ncbi:MAG: hypothetical protein ACJ0DJ_06205 [bacterium]|nr:hypothetical protein [Deltaproteobacteria bacterium]|tara:strand:+ start:10465 stop:10959 length:495 start_codon:yes stop_codon:yes gene_type:complete
MECSTSDIPLNTKKRYFPNNINVRSWKTKLIIPLFFLLLNIIPSHAQETGPLLMKQELGYTLGGGVFGAGLGIVVWFMDPLNPNVTLKSTVQNGFIAGTALGALFGFYMLQNAIIIPQENKLPENLDQLLGRYDLSGPIHRSIVSKEESISDPVIRLKIFGFQF